ncbi:DUF1612 domain-containing protein [Methylosinus sp. LW3]|uniref:DUF1612 domain-containing protein n=1 Tax=Methylosinus sp. LW3 TaxID=107635 RepID=UPI001FD89C1D|nr:DUF1612 domain-containing protein [Methylosinus sp. LW3]
MLAAALLQRRGKTRHHLSALHAGFRNAKFRTSRQSDYGSRLMVFTHAVELMAKADSSRASFYSENAKTAERIRGCRGLSTCVWSRRS